MNTMHDIPEMTVRQHHLLCLGVLHLAYPFVPKPLQIAIQQAMDSAKAMGQRIVPQNLNTSKPLCPDGPEEN